jgi:hypothetical protein
MTDTPQLSPTGRLVLWVLGTALFVDIAFYPYYLFMQYAPDSEVYTKVGIATTVLVLLLWLASAFGPLKARQ